MSQIRVVAHLRAKADQIDALRSILAGLVAPTQAEEGCIAYDLCQNADDPADFTFVEAWTSRAALETHLATDHVQGALAAAGEMFEGAPDIRVYHQIA